MPRQRMTLPLYPLAAGMVNRGRRTLMPENSAWDLQNFSTDLSGSLYKRDGFRQWGLPLTLPTEGGIAYTEIFNDLSHFTVNTSDAPSADSFLERGHLILKTTVTNDGFQASFVTRNVHEGDGTQDLDQLSLKLLFRSRGPLPAYSSAVDADTFSITLRVPDPTEFGGFGTIVSLFDDGVYIRDTGAAMSLVADTKVDDGRWHELELQLDEGATNTMTVILDGDVKATSVEVGTGGAVLVPSGYIALHTQTNSAITHEVEVAMLQVRSTITNPFTRVPVLDIFPWEANQRKYLMASTTNLIYTDEGHAGTWLPLDTTFSDSASFFTAYQNQLVICSPGQPIRVWGGKGLPEAIPNSPEAAFGTEHIGRLFVVDPREPLVIQFSAALDITRFLNPDDPTSLLDTGVVPISAPQGARITALLGNFHGQLIVGTTAGIFKIVGDFIQQGGNPPNFAVQKVNENVDIVGPRAIVRAGNDAIFISSQGLHSLGATEKFGEVETEFLSSPVRSRWIKSVDNTAKTVRPDTTSKLVYHPQTNKLFLAVRLDGDTTNQHIFEANLSTGQWSGPWTLDCGALSYVRLAYPELPTIMTGTSNGLIGYQQSGQKNDFGAGYVARMESQKINGRLLDPTLTRFDKTWSELRIYISPRGQWDILTQFSVDEVPVKPEETESQYRAELQQNVYERHLLTENFHLNVSRLWDADTEGFVTVPLDLHGRWMEFAIEQSGLDEDILITGMDIEFMPNRVTQEHV